MLITTELIKKYNPCKSGIDNWSLVTKDKPIKLNKFFNLKNIPDRDKIWLLCRILPRNIIEVFAIDCAFAAAAAAARLEQVQVLKYLTKTMGVT